MSNHILRITGINIETDDVPSLNQAQIIIRIPPPTDLSFKQVGLDGIVSGLITHLPHQLSIAMKRDDNDDDDDSSIIEYTFHVSLDPSSVITTLENCVSPVIGPASVDIIPLVADSQDGDTSSNDEIESDDGCSSIVQYLKQGLLKNLEVSVDTHWDCYCKHQSVCGCGCDPLHDGW